MELKKNPQADLNRNSGLYFVIGLTVVLFTTWRLVEHKTYDTQVEYTNTLNVADDFKEEVPITQQLLTAPPPPPVAAPSVIEIVEDIQEVEETVITSTEIDQNTFIEDAVVSLEEIHMEEEEEEEVLVPFAIIENAPVFPGCEGFDSEQERKKCFSVKIQEHIRTHFRYPQMAQEMGISGRVFLQFEIDKQGRVINIRKRGPDKLLEDEGVRIITALPKMKPGLQRGNPATVGYSIPINFVLH